MRTHHGQPETTAPGREPGRGRAGAAVEVSHLRESDGAVVAVDDVSFSVREGEIFGVLGPNGAGQSRSGTAC